MQIVNQTNLHQLYDIPLGQLVLLLFPLDFSNFTIPIYLNLINLITAIFNPSNQLNQVSYQMSSIKIKQIDNYWLQPTTTNSILANLIIYLHYYTTIKLLKFPMVSLFLIDLIAPPEVVNLLNPTGISPKQRSMT